MSALGCGVSNRSSLKSCAFEREFVLKVVTKMRKTKAHSVWGWTDQIKSDVCRSTQRGEDNVTILRHCAETQTVDWKSLRSLGKNKDDYILVIFMSLYCDVYCISLSWFLCSKNGQAVRTMFFTSFSRFHNVEKQYFSQVIFYVLLWEG